MRNDSTRNFRTRQVFDTINSGKKDFRLAIRNFNSDYYHAPEKSFNYDDDCLKNGNTVTHEAAKIGRLEIVEYLVNKKKVNLKKLNNLGYTPLHIAVSFGNVKVARFLLEQDSSMVNTPAFDTKESPIYLAIDAVEPNLEMIELLIEFGASGKGYDDTLKFIALHKIPIFRAAEHCDGKIIEVLLKNGASVNCTTSVENDRRTPLMISLRAGNVSASKVFMQTAGICWIATDAYGGTYLHVAAKHKNNFELIPDLANFLSKTKIGLETLDTNSQTPLHVSVYYETYLCAVNFVELGAPLNIPDCNGNTPMHLFLSSESERFANLYLQCKSPPRSLENSPRRKMSNNLISSGKIALHNPVIEEARRNSADDIPIAPSGHSNSRNFLKTRSKSLGSISFLSN